MQQVILTVLLYQEIMHFFKTFFSIVIVCIDDSKRCVDHALAAQKSLAGAPWFGAAVRNGKSVRQSGQILKGIRSVCDFRDAIPDDASEVLFDILADDKYDFIESCL